MKEKIKSLERDNEGRLLPTLRNKDIIEGISDECGRDYNKIIKTIGKQLYLEYTKAALFNPKNKNVYWPTKKRAIEGMQRARLIDEYNKKYLEEKKISSRDKEAIKGPLSFIREFLSFVHVLISLILLPLLVISDIFYEAIKDIDLKKPKSLIPLLFLILIIAFIVLIGAYFR